MCEWRVCVCVCVCVCGQPASPSELTKPSSTPGILIGSTRVARRSTQLPLGPRPPISKRIRGASQGGGGGSKQSLTPGIRAQHRPSSQCYLGCLCDKPCVLEPARAGPWQREECWPVTTHQSPRRKTWQQQATLLHSDPRSLWLPGQSGLPVVGRNIHI